MGVGETSASWAEMAKEARDDEEPQRSTHVGEPAVPVVSLATQSDWVLLLGFTAVMTIPFAFVAWLMH